MLHSNAMRNLILVITLASFLTACGGRKPDPVAEYKVGDEALTCNGIRAEAAYIDMQVSKLIPEQKKAGKNVVLGVTGYFLLVPWFFMDFSRAERIEIDAYQQRYLALQQLADKKGCNVANTDELAEFVDRTDTSDRTVDPEQADSLSETENPLAAETNTVPERIDAVAKRLEVLHDFYAAGLISDEEYAERRKVILDEAMKE